MKKLLAEVYDLIRIDLISKQLGHGCMMLLNWMQFWNIKMAQFVGIFDIYKKITYYL